MSEKKLVLILTVNQAYIRHIEEGEKNRCAAEINGLFESISNIYIPLLRMFEVLESEQIPFKLQIVLPPILCTLLEDPVVQAQYVEFLDKQIALGESEKKRVNSDKKLLKIVNHLVANFKNLKSDFTEKYSMRIIPQFALYQQKGYLEIMATTATSAFLPFYADLKEVVDAQIEMGLISYKKFFGEIPEGFWLPHLGYTQPLEKSIRSYGLDYTVLDPRSVLFAKEPAEKGIFFPCKFYNSLVAFSIQKNTDSILFGDEGFSSNCVYRNENRDICFDLPLKNLQAILSEGNARFSTGYKYFNRACISGEYSANPSNEEYYDFDEAMKQADEDSHKFIAMKNEELDKARELANDVPYVSEVCVIDLQKMQKNWSEGLKFIEQLFRNASEADFDFETCGKLLNKQHQLQKITPYSASSIGTGYGENLLSNKNNWMMRYIRKASERMVDLTERFPTDTGLKERLLNLAAKELMIAQSSIWALMLDENCFAEYAADAFKKSILAFTTVFDSLGSNTVSTEWLTNIEANHPIFPWMNYRIFSKKM